MTRDDRDGTIAELRDQVSELEAIVRRRSKQLRLIQNLACAKDRALISEILDSDGSHTLRTAAIRDYYAMNWSDETTQFVPSSVEGELHQLSSAPTWMAPEAEVSE